MEYLVIKKCLHCKATVKVIQDCNCHDCGITCCNEPMKTLKANESDGATEKHKPVYKIVGDKLEVSVNHVMNEDHYIEWFCLVTDNKEEYIYLLPGDTPTAKFDKVSSGILYSYCNKHDLWMTEIK